jgi:hypothetical protein
MTQPEPAACHKNVRETSSRRNRLGGQGVPEADFERGKLNETGVQAGGSSPRRLAMILSTIRFGRMAVITCRIGSGVTW